MSHLATISSVAKMLPSYRILLILVGIYLFSLLLVNFIPCFRVRHLGWMSLCKVTLSLPQATITIERASLRLNLSRKSMSPFRMVTIQLCGIVVIKHDQSTESNNSHCSGPSDHDLKDNALSLEVPASLYNFFYERNWLNEVCVQLYHVSFYHHALHEKVSLHLDYVKIENSSDVKDARNNFSILVLDGYVNDTSEGSDIAGLQLFHNLELSIKCDLVFSCISSNTGYLKLDLSNFDILIILGHLRICKLSKLLEKRKNMKRDLPESKPREFPSLQCMLSKLDSVSSVQLKLDQSEIHFKELTVLSSSYSLNYSRDKTYKHQTTAKLSSYVTAAKLYHLDLKCMEIPALTYILDIDLSDFYRSLESDQRNKFSVDLYTTLSMTNPSFSIYFDQWAYLLDLTQSESKPKSKTPSHIEDNFTTYLMHIRKCSVKVVIVDLKLQLHMPKLETDKFFRLSSDNVISSAGSQGLAFKFSSKNLGNLIQKKGNSISPIALKGYFKLRNVYVEVEENTIYMSSLSALVGYCLESHKIALKVSARRFQLKSVNTMIFHLIRRLREAKINSSNRAYTRMNSQNPSSTEESSSWSEEIKQEIVDLFEILPPIFHSIKLRVSLILSYIVCNDFLPLHIIHDESQDKDIDLSEFKRGISCMANGLAVDYKREEKSIEARLKQLQVNTLSECASEYVEDFDERNTDPLGHIDVSDASSIESGLSGFSQSESLESVNTVKKVLHVEDVILKNTLSNQNKLILSVPEVDARVDMYLVWCIMYAYTLVEMIAPKVKVCYSQREAKKLKGVSRVVDLDIEVACCSVVVRLPHDVDILLEADNFVLTDICVSPHCQISYVRLYVVHPATKCWSRLVSITDIDVDFDTISRKSVLLKSRAIRFNIPFEYLVYTVIDNVITFCKAAVQIGFNFSHLSTNIHDYTRIEPKAEEAVILPRIHLKSDVMGITLENDDFESQLGLIFQLGVIENIERMRKLAAFEKEATEMRSQSKASLSSTTAEPRRFLRKSTRKRKPNVLTKAFFNTSADKDQDRTTKHSKNSTDKETFQRIDSDNDGESSFKFPAMTIIKDAFTGNHCKNSSSKNSSTKLSHQDSQADTGYKSNLDQSAQGDEDEMMDDEEIEAVISEGRNKLLCDFSSSWVNKFQRFKRSKHNSWKKRMESIWGLDKVNKLMRTKFDIQEYSPGAPQFQGVFKDLDLIIDDPHLEDLHHFLYKYGKGQPKLEYSILVPALIHWRSSSVYMSLRDYALPFISFPDSGDPDLPVMDLKGTFVINEKLVQIREELREIFVPFSPATKAQRIVDNFYSVSVVRTLTPVKIMFDLKSTLNTNRACVVSWCKSYQPALLSAMMAFENFTKPEIDDSPLGWWDKLALTAHGKVRFDIKHELCLHMKSSISPYALIGHNAGLVFCWKENVLLRINETGIHSELVILDSDDFILGIPNYSDTEGRAWSLLETNASAYSALDGDDDTDKFQKVVMKLTSDEKVAWRLGFLFERNKDVKAKELGADMERTNQFKPHFDVTVTGPQYEYHPDSFEGYRSDYTHLAMSVNSSSKNGNSHNYAYFTPLTLHYFKVWWKTLNDDVSLPIREGKLFAQLAFKDSSVKFGPHLFSLKYQLVIEPLTVSDTYLASGGKETNHSVISYGLKGKASKCVIDLHQRREIVRYVNEKLGIDKKVRKLQMNLGEVEVSDADIRLIFAQFNDVSMIGKLISYYSGEESRSIDLDTYEREIKEQNARNKAKSPGLVSDENDYHWIDFEDFVELEEHEILSPDSVIKVLPFFSAPRFTFFREFSVETREGAHPFGREPAHKCLLGSSSPEEVQAQLLDLRLNEVKNQLDRTVEVTSKHSNNGDDSRGKRRHDLRGEIAHWTKKSRDLHKLREKYSSNSYDLNFEDLSKLGSRRTSMSGGHEDLNRHLSRVTLLYSAISSLDQAREMMNTNSLLSNYHNRFLIHNLKIKWSNEVRDIFSSFLSVVGHRNTESLSMSRKALDLMDKLLKSSERKKLQSQNEPSLDFENKFTCGDDVIQEFDEYLTSLESDDEEIEPSYIVKFIKPQVCFRSDINPKATVLMTANDIELRVLHVNNAGTDDVITTSLEDTSLLETRYGLLCREACVLVFHEDELSCDSKNEYANGERKLWPHWLNLEESDQSEVCRNNLVFERNTMALSLKKPNMLAASTRGGQMKKSEVVIHIPKLVINATSQQYSAFYFIITDLLIHGNYKNYFLQRIEQISSVTETSDYANLTDKIQLLQNNIRICKILVLKMNQRSLKLSETKRRQYSHIKLELCRMRIELGIIIKSLEAKSSNQGGLKAFSRSWKLHVDQLIFHILDDSRKPFVDFALATSVFSRLEEADGSNANSVEVSLVQGFNLRENVVYPELLQPFMTDEVGEKDEKAYDAKRPMISMEWKMLNPVGGIQVMSNANLTAQPIKILLDYDTASDLFDYLFPKDDGKMHDENEGGTDKHNNSSNDEDGTEVADDSTGSPSITSPSQTFKMLWSRGKTSTTDSSSIFTRHSHAEDSSSADTHSVTSSKQLSNSRRVPASRGLKKELGSEEKTDDNIAVIMKRSARYFVIGDFRMNDIKLCISFKAPRHLNIIDVHNLEFPLPALHYKDKTWSSNDFILQLKKDVIKIFLSNSGKIIGNKFKIKKRKRITSPLKQISDFSQFLTLQDLQLQGGSRDSLTPSLASKTLKTPHRQTSEANNNGSRNLVA